LDVPSHYLGMTFRKSAKELCSIEPQEISIDSHKTKLPAIIT